MTYERPAILKWLESRRHDPCTKAPLRKRHLAPNLALRGVIETWVLEQCRRRQASFPCCVFCLLDDRAHGFPQHMQPECARVTLKLPFAGGYSRWSPQRVRQQS